MNIIENIDNLVDKQQQPTLYDCKQSKLKLLSCAIFIIQLTKSHRLQQFQQRKKQQNFMFIIISPFSMIRRFMKQLHQTLTNFANMPF